MIDAYASLRHYADHLAPIWAGLPEQVRGTFWSPTRMEPWGRPLNGQRDHRRLTLVASHIDEVTAGGPVVYLEHGAGQTYAGVPSSSYSGGPGHGAAVLFLCPNETVADRWRASYPSTPAVAVGCPRLDRWHGESRPFPTGTPTVAVTFHWDCGLCPETRSAWRYYDRALGVIARDPRWVIMGHGHPRLWGTIRGRWDELGVYPAHSADDVFAMADLLVVDNSSLAYEFASLGRPVLLLNQPGYRRGVEHGLRFWSHPPGHQIDRPDQLAAGIELALTDPPDLAALRPRAVEAAYAYTDGRATERAVSAILEVYERA